jgi:RNA polymerase sigma-54 factor
MALMQRLELRQGQSLVMTPQLQQAIKLLQMSNLELQAFVETELERNPLLERDERAEASLPAKPEAAAPDVASEISNDAQVAERLERLDTGLDNLYADESRADAANRGVSPAGGDGGWSSLRQSRNSSFDSDEMSFDATLTKSETLAEHLTEQMVLSVDNATDRLIAQHLIGMVNEAGYLTGDLVSVADTLGANLVDVERVLRIVQELDPPGVFARDLKECLALQLKDKDRFDPAMALLVDHLELIAKRDFAALKSICRVDLDDIRDMIAEIRGLNPKPGHAFGVEPVQPVVPDIFVRLASDGSWQVELNSETLPKVLVNNQYMARVAKGAAREEDRLYLSDCHANATWLVKSLDQRAKTILKVAREIVRQQDTFFVLGVQHLKPLNLKTVADAIAMHESTVSRVTSNKYLASPRGIFELKYFFTTAIASAEADGEAHSAESVRHRIKSLIDAETTEAILSDDTIVDILKQEGVVIARRTIAKYRESLGILSSVQRRREKKAFAS